MWKPHINDREYVLRCALLNGPAWETPAPVILAALAKQSVKSMTICLRRQVEEDDGRRLGLEAAVLPVDAPCIEATRSELASQTRAAPEDLQAEGATTILQKEPVATE